MAPPSRLRWPRRPGPRSPVWPLLLYSCIAAVLLTPFASRNLVVHGEVYGIVAGVVEARAAIHEGQFPLRVLPWQNGGTRYPLFQFYGNLPFTLAGLISLLPQAGPYSAWKWLTFLALLCGGCFTYRSSRLITRRPVVSLVAGAVYLTAPYLMTDLYARGAMAELVALCLLPAALFYTFRCFRSRRRAVRSVTTTAVAWSAIALTHNITYLYGVLFVGALVLSYAGAGRRSVPRAVRLTAAGGLHALLVLWYFVPQWYAVKDLNISAGIADSPAWSAMLTPPAVLLWPVCRTPAASTTPGLGLQVGWPILASAVVAVLVLLFPARRIAGRGIAARLLVLFVFALFMAWSPVDFWRYLPRPLHFVQFTYRLLGFVALFGSLLSAWVLAVTLPRKVPGRGAAALAGGLLLVLAPPAATYPPKFHHHPRGAVRWILARPLMSGRTDYQLSPEATARTSISTAEKHVIPAAETRPLIHYGRRTWCEVKLDRPTVVVLPVLYYPRLLRVHVNGRPAEYGNLGEFVALELPPGAQRIEVWFTGVGWANAVGVVGLALLTAGAAFSLMPRRRRT